MAIQTPATTKMVQNVIDGTTVPRQAMSAAVATNVSTQINGKAITNIFESDGLKVKKATLADNAANVTTNINGKAISNIFESNGTTAKKATLADKATIADRATTADKVANALTLQVNDSSTVYNGSVAQIVEVSTINPNILINPDFSINQRGESTYSGTKYTFDRWKKTSNPTTGNVFGTVYSSKSTLTGYPGLSNGAYIQQAFEDYLQLGSYYTLTFRVQSDVAGELPITKSFTYELPETLPTSSKEFIAERIYLNSSNTYYATAFLGYRNSHFYVGISATLASSGSYSKVKLGYAKLEQGREATPFMTPDAATELLKCQRFYIKSDLRARAALYAGAIYQRGQVSFPCTMRVIPTISSTKSTSVSVYELQCQDGFMFGANNKNECTLEGYEADAEI